MEKKELFLLKDVSNKGVVFSFEALLALIIFILILLNLNLTETNSLKELLILEQENDLLKVWSVDFPSESEMLIDSSKLFSNFELYLNEKKLSSAKIKNQSIASEATILDDNLVENKIRIIVYFD